MSEEQKQELAQYIVTYIEYEIAEKGNNFDDVDKNMVYNAIDAYMNGAR